MNEVFPRGPSLLTRFVIILVVSLCAMLIDTKVENVNTLRTYLTSLVSPIQYIAEAPSAVLNWSAEKLTSRQQTMEENDRLKTHITLLRSELQRIAALEQENKNLRRLMSAPVQQGMSKIIAELMSIDNNPYSHQIVLNKGTIDDVFIGQAVLDDNGIVGQVIEVGTTNSRVLLISDITHAIPVRVNRNNVRTIAIGSGDIGELRLQHLPHSTDIVEGDLLISSGLGQVFPEGYPVGIVSKIVSDEGQPFAEVVIKPAAALDRLKYLLLLWPEDIAPEDAVSAEELISELEVIDAAQ